MKNVIVISDLHCGHKTGLTPPAWQIKKDRFPAISAYQKASWTCYKGWAKENQNPDLLVVNGDCIDGRGEKSNSVELLTSDRLEQCTMAQRVIEQWNAKKIVMLRGTPYHTGKGVDYENVIAERIEAEIYDKINIKIEDVIVNFRHKASRSSIPHGRHTPIAKERLWNKIDNETNAHIFIRSHVHYYSFCGGLDWNAITTPALQGKSKYGSKICTGMVDFGLLKLQIEQGEWTWEALTAQLEESNHQMIKV